MSQPVVLAASAGAAVEGAAFWVLAVIAVLAALGMIAIRRVVHSAMLLAVVMLILAAMYAMQGAPFLAFVQVIVYTGAVLMLFLFVMMIVGISASDSIVETIRGQRLAAGLAGIALLVLLVLVVGHAAIGPAAPAGPRNGNGNITGLAALIFTKYVFAFEITSAAAGHHRPPHRGPPPGRPPRWPPAAALGPRGAPDPRLGGDPAPGGRDRGTRTGQAGRCRPAG